VTVRYYTGIAYLASISSSKWRKAVALSLDLYFIPAGGSTALLLDAVHGANEAGSRSTQKRWNNSDVYRSMAEVFEQHEGLNTEERSRFDDQIMAASERLILAGKQHQHLATLPIGQPDPIPKKTWRKRDSHGKGARAMTAAENSGTRSQGS
jgi:hypothetical protein